MAKKKQPPKTNPAPAPHALPAQAEVSNQQFVALEIPLTRIHEMIEVRHRQFALEVWHAASRLRGMLELANQFYRCATLGLTISDEFQNTINSLFNDEPALRNVQRILKHVAAVDTTMRSAVVAPTGMPFPLADYSAIIILFPELIKRYAQILVNHHVDSDQFTSMESISSCLFLFGGLSLCGTEVPNPLPIEKNFPVDEYVRLSSAVQKLLDRLKVEPSRVVPAPVYPVGTAAIISTTSPSASAPPPSEASEVKPRLRLWVDRQKNIIWVGEDPYNCEPEQVAFVDVLLRLRANGARFSLERLKEYEPGLKEVPRVDRLRESLPKQVQLFIGKKRGSGNWIKSEML